MRRPNLRRDCQFEHFPINSPEHLSLYGARLPHSIGRVIASVEITYEAEAQSSRGHNNFVAAAARPGPFHQRAHWLRYSRIGVAAQSSRLCGSDVAPGSKPTGQHTRGRTRVRAAMRRLPRALWSRKRACGAVADSSPTRLYNWIVQIQVNATWAAAER